jgi:aromatic ring-opening dioxygenase LigB subunit
MIVFGAIAPHGAHVFDVPESPTRTGMEELRHRFDAVAPEAVIVVTPHGFQVDGHLAVVRSSRLKGDARPWTEADTLVDGPGDPELADACLAALRADGLPAVGVLFGTAVVQGWPMPLDWGTVIPLWFMRAPAVVVTPTHALSNAELVRAGAALARATGDRRVAFVASADHGHGHTEDAPYGWSAESEPYDAAVQEAVRGNRLGDLVAWDPAWAREAKADSLWQLLMLHGALEEAGGGRGFDAELLSYEAPTYFGMLTAAFAPK